MTKHGSGKLAGIVFGILGKPDDLHDIFDALIRNILGEMLDFKPVADVVLHCQPLHGRVFLKNVSDIVLFRVDFLAAERDGTGVNVIQPTETVEEGRFAAARRPDYAEKFTLPNVEGYVVENQQVSEAFCEIFYRYLDLVFSHSARLPYSVLSISAVICSRSARNSGAV